MNEARDMIAVKYVRHVEDQFKLLNYPVFEPIKP